MAASIKIQATRGRNGADLLLAVKQTRKCLDLDPNYPLCLWIQGLAYEQQGHFEDAIGAETKALKIDPDWTFALACLARAYALSGRRADAQQILNDMLDPSKHSHVSKYMLATVHAALGDKSHALAELEQAYAERSFFLGFLKSDPEVDPLRSEPRFQAILRSMNFPQ